ncbi:hypothetical protein Tco_0519509 [Tanacetum coccineum]
MVAFPRLEERVQLIDRTNDKKLFITEHEGVPPSVMSCNFCEFLHKVQDNDFIILLEMRKMMIETYREIVGLEELASAKNSNTLSDAMSVNIQRRINADIHFVVGLNHLWDVLYNMVNERRLLTVKLNAFGGPLAVQCAEFLK